MAYLALIDPFQLHNELPEMIEAKLQVAAAVLVCAFNRRGNLLAGGCADSRVVVWDFETHGVARLLEGHTSRVSSVSWTRSSRKLLSSAADGLLMRWEVLSGEESRRIDLGREIFLSCLHPRNRRMCLACVQATASSRSAVYLQYWEPETRTTLSEPEEAVEETAGGGGAGGSRRSEAPSVACFDSTGERVLIGTARGVARLVKVSTGEQLATLQIAGGAAIKSVTISRDGKSCALNCADRIVRAVSIERLLEGGKATGRELQDVVNRVQWSHATFSADSEHVLGASASNTEQKIYIWDLRGQLTRMLDGPKDGTLSLSYHPTRPIIACCTRSGAVFIWTKQYCENWSAFAPDFKELEENEEYDEREDEFDILPPQDEHAEEEEDELIDVVTCERSELAHVPDADDDEEELLFIPTRPDPDDDGHGAAGGAEYEPMEVDATDKHPKARKRKGVVSDAGKGLKRSL